MSRKDRPSADLVERTRLQKALRESVILRELADILNSSLDLEQILQKLVIRTTELCDVTRCAVWLLEEPWKHFHPVTYYISSPELAAEMMQSADAVWHRSPLPGDNPIIQRLLNNDGMLSIEDLRAEPTVQNFAETFRTHSVLLIALLREGRPVGMMSLDDPGQIRSFSQEQQQLARAIGQQATIAIYNARLYQQAQAQQMRAEHLIERARAIYQVAMTVNSGAELPAVLRLATHHLVQALEAQDGLVMLLENDKSTLRPASSTSNELQMLPLSLAHLPNVRQAISTGRPMLINAKQAGEHELAWFNQRQLKNLLLVPLMGGQQPDENAEEQPGGHEEPGRENGTAPEAVTTSCLGLIAIYYTQRRRPTRGEYAFAQDIAAQCALAIEKAHLLLETQQAAELANERANTLDAVFQSLTEGITVITPDGQVSIRNATAAQFLGVPLYSSTPIETFLQRHLTYTLEGQPLAYENFPLVRALRSPNSDVRGERFLTTRADGARRVVEVTATPLKNKEQGQIGLVTAFRDITIQMQAEQRIRLALDTFLHIAEAVSYSTDIREILHRVLAEALTTLHCRRGMVHLFQPPQDEFEPLLSLGFSPEEESHWLQEQHSWLHPETTGSSQIYTKLTLGQTVLIGEEQGSAQAHPLSPGTMVLAAPLQHNQRLLGLLLLERSTLSTSLIQKPTGFTTWDIAIVEGIAQLAGVAMEQARWQQEAIEAQASATIMREADTMKNEFLAITAHEFRNPLTVILARSQSALRTLRRTAAEKSDATTSSPAESHLETIIAQTKQLNNIVTTFLDAARINQGSFTLKTEVVDLDRVACQVIEDQQALVEKHTLHCNIDGTRGPYQVTGDPARLAQIIANLVENAVKYSPHGGSITVSLRRLEQEPALIEVCVQDEGMGIPLDSQARLFERFYRVPHAASGETRGIGLGLYIVAHLVHMHGGSIRVESSGIPGEGSCFIFTLPASPEENAS
jgi:PAS domain S-box-containing protein